jgi:hypothetical protein
VFKLHASRTGFSRGERSIGISASRTCVRAARRARDQHQEKKGKKERKKGQGNESWKTENKSDNAHQPQSVAQPGPNGYVQPKNLKRKKKKNEKKRKEKKRKTEIKSDHAHELYIPTKADRAERTRTTRGLLMLFTAVGAGALPISRASVAQGPPDAPTLESTCYTKQHRRRGGGWSGVGGVGGRIVSPGCG